MSSLPARSRTEIVLPDPEIALPDHEISVPVPEIALPARLATEQNATLRSCNR